MTNVSEVIRRIKNLKKFEIVKDFPPEFEFRGPTPYDLKIKDGRITLKIFALTQEEAEQKAEKYLNG
jgi:hypothetical protein